MTDFREQVQHSLGSSYTIDRELGGGGMSRVFVARDASLSRNVVIKVLPDEMAASVSIDRFKREIALAARLQHPHIVPLFNAGDIDGLPYFTMPFVEGESLRARLTRAGELPVAEGLRILREVASALDYAHEKGVVHRDIKPDNVLLSRGSAMVTDFGVAKALSASSNAENSGMTSLGVALGTPAYMSPEQAAASPNIDARADVYAFGVMAYELFAGRPPFAGRSPQAMLAAHVTEAPENILKLRPTLPPALAALIMRCLEKHPADRPQSAAEIVHALDSINTPSGGMQPTGAMPSFGATKAQTAPLPDRSGKRNALLGAGLAAAILAVVLVAAAMSRRAPHASDTSSEASRAAPSAVAKSIAVVPFTGGDAHDEYFADGVADELTSMLARIPDLGVAARSSAFAFKGKPLSSRQIGESLHVSTVVEGTVRRAESRLRITASLVNVANGLTLWSDSYDRDARDVFAVQDEIAHKIAEQLKVTLGARSSGTTNLAAHDAYLQGRFHAAKLVEPEQRQAIAFYEKAIKLDSSYADAWASLAQAWMILADDWVPPKEGYSKGMAAARRALALDPNNAEAHAALGAALAFHDWNYPDALRETSRAVELEPSSSIALWDHGFVLATIPRFQDSALVVFRKYEALDPEDVVAASFACLQLRAAKRYPEADRECQRALSLDPSSPDAIEMSARLYDAEGRSADALRLLANPAPSLGRLLADRIRVYFDMGRPDDARRTMDEVERLERTQYVRHDLMASYYLRLGDRPRMDAQLERDWTEESTNLNAFPFDDPRIKDDARAQAVGKLVRAKEVLMPPR